MDGFLALTVCLVRQSVITVAGTAQVFHLIARTKYDAKIPNICQLWSIFTKLICIFAL